MLFLFLLISSYRYLILRYVMSCFLTRDSRFGAVASDEPRSGHVGGYDQDLIMDSSEGEDYDEEEEEVLVDKMGNTIISPTSGGSDTA